MMRTKMLTAIVMAVMAAGALAACGSDQVPAAERTVITFAYPEYLTAFNQANYERLAKAFNQQNPDLHVDLRVVSTEELMGSGRDYLSLLLDGDWGVDVFLSRGFQHLVEGEEVLPLDDLIAARPEVELDDFFPLALELMRHQGQLRGLPAELDLVVLFYNQDLFDQAGVPYPAVDWTRDGFLATAVALRKALPETEMVFGGQVDQAVPFVYAHGGRVEDEGSYTLTDPLTVQAVSWFADLALVHGVMPLPQQVDAYQPEAREGRIISSVTTGGGEIPEAELRWVMIGGQAEVAAQEGDVALWAFNLSDRQGTGGWDWDFEWGIVPWPHDQQPIFIGYPFAYFISGETPHREAALRWVDFLSRQPPQLKGIPARRSVAEEARRSFEREIGAEAYEACLRIVEEGTPIEYHLYYAAERYLGQAMLAILADGQEVEQALSGAQARLESGGP
jgi:ABC-type glycerol-3-phosphate transport system substrate-binding protein